MKSFLTPATRQFIIFLIIFLMAILGIAFLYHIRDLLGIFGISCFTALLLTPFVIRLRRWGVPEVLGILATFMGVFGAIILFFVSIIPLFVGLAEDSKAYVVRTISFVELQATHNFPLLNSLPFHAGDLVRREVDLTKISGLLLDNNRAQLITTNLVKNIDTLKNLAQEGLGQLSNFGLSLASGLTTVLTTVSVFLLLTFFIILERRSLLKWFFNILPSDLGHYFHGRQHRISHAIHSWLRAQIILAIFMFAINLLGLYIGQLIGIPVKNIFSLALIAGAMEFVPYAGPIIAFVFGFVTVLVSPDVGMWSLVGIMGLYFLFQQLEGNIMVPLIMSHSLSLSSLYILIVTLVGGALGGALGVLLAIPLASILNIFYHDWMHYRRTAGTSDVE